MALRLTSLARHSLIIEQILIGPKKAYQRSAAGEQQEGEDCAPEAVGTEAGALEANASAFHHSHHHDPHSSSFSRVLAIPREELGDDDEEGPSSSGPSKDALTGLMVRVERPRRNVAAVDAGARSTARQLGSNFAAGGSSSLPSSSAST